MLTRSIQRWVTWMPICLLVAATGFGVMAKAAASAEEGKVEAVEITYGAPDNKPLNGGAVIGGLAGGVIGHQIGSGRGRTAATVAGAVGGAVVGSEMERRQGQATPRYRISVRLDSGSVLVVEDTRDPNLRVGDRVRMESGHLHRM